MKWKAAQNGLLTGLIVLALIFPLRLTANHRSGPAELKVGDQAPELKSIKWFNGPPVHAFEKGMIYIVEFGFVGCAPCRLSIPELTRLQAKFPSKLRVVSMHIWENSRSQPENLAYVDRVEKFVAKMGSKMGYTVGVDVPIQATADHWMKAAGLEAVPKSFIVDSDGKLAWIGQPGELAGVIEKMMMGPFDAGITEKKQKTDKARFDKRRNDMLVAKDKDNYTFARAMADSLLVEFPNEISLYFDKFRILNDQSDAETAIYVRWMLTEHRKDFDVMMFYICKGMLSKPSADFDVAILAADRGIAITEYIPSQAWILDAKAEAYYKKGMLEQAVSVQKQAVDSHRPYGRELSSSQANLEQRLERYRKLLEQR